MDQDKLKALAAELAKDIKSEKDLGTLTQQLIKLTVETALNAEMDASGLPETRPTRPWDRQQS
jgi:transposase-like protein